MWSVSFLREQIMESRLDRYEPDGLIHCLTRKVELGLDNRAATQTHLDRFDSTFMLPLKTPASQIVSVNYMVNPQDRGEDSRRLSASTSELLGLKHLQLCHCLLLATKTRGP